MVKQHHRLNGHAASAAAKSLQLWLTLFPTDGSPPGSLSLGFSGVSANSRRQRRTEEPGVLQSMGTQRADSFEKTLMLGTIEGKRRRGRQRVRCLDSITNSMDMSLNKLQGTVKDQKAWHSAVRRVTKTRT